MPAFRDTPLWTRTLAARADDEAEAARDRLRDAYLAMRQRAIAIAEAIGHDLPEFTVHDESHFDALWEMASLLTQDDVQITPTEAFVLGGAFLIHDLGMGLAAFPAGIAHLRELPVWADSVALILRQTGASPTQEMIRDAPQPIQEAAMHSVLRSLHAQQAEAVATQPWSTEGGDSQYLIENDDLRSSYGHLIGRIAHSHWWEASRLADEFGTPLGAPAWSAPECPVTWTLDPLKIAALLRAADAIHLDARRAPRFLRTLRRPTGVSSDHWAFQEKLNRPLLERDRVTFTSSTPFSIEDADAWWTCYDVLRQVDHYLLEIDAVLASAGKTGLAARGVAALESPEHLSRRIPTVGWEPVESNIHISDVAHLVRILGGEELYGDTAGVALRELLQNAGDAIRARRVVEDRPDDWGEITVSLLEKQGDWWLEVQDTGVGMSRRVLTDVLLDFGRSYWTSDIVTSELPGLLGSGFAAVGRYGIGFFSVLMLGDEVKVVTRRLGAALEDSSVLIFADGVRRRPLLRDAQDDELLTDGGTKVSVRLRRHPLEPDGLLWRWSREPWTLAALIRRLAPAFDVTISARDEDASQIALEGHDWLQIEPPALLDRTYAPEYVAEDARFEDLLELAGNLRVLLSEDGQPVARALIYPMTSVGARFGVSEAGTIAVGGLYAADLEGIAGVFLGEPQRAARDLALPIVSLEALGSWANEQAQMLTSELASPQLQAAAASVVLRCGGDPSGLRICETDTGWLTRDELREWVRGQPEVTVLTGPEVANERARGTTVDLAPGSMWVPYSYSLLREHVAAEPQGWPPGDYFAPVSLFDDLDEVPDWMWQERNSPLGLVIMFAAEQWGVDDIELLRASLFRFPRRHMVAAATRAGEPFLLAPEAILRRPA